MDIALSIVKGVVGGILVVLLAVALGALLIYLRARCDEAYLEQMGYNGRQQWLESEVAATMELLPSDPLLSKQLRSNPMALQRLYGLWPMRSKIEIDYALLQDATTNAVNLTDDECESLAGRWRRLLCETKLLNKEYEFLKTQAVSTTIVPD